MSVGVVWFEAFVLLIAGFGERIAQVEDWKTIPKWLTNSSNRMTS